MYLNFRLQLYMCEYTLPMFIAVCVTWCSLQWRYPIQNHLLKLVSRMWRCERVWPSHALMLFILNSAVFYIYRVWDLHVYSQGHRSTCLYLALWELHSLYVLNSTMKCFRLYRLRQVRVMASYMPCVLIGLVWMTVAVPVQMNCRTLNCIVL